MTGPLLLVLLFAAPKSLCPADLAALDRPAWGQTEASLRQRLPLTPPVITHDYKHKWRWMGTSCVAGLPAFVTYGFSGERLMELWISIDSDQVKLSPARFEQVKALMVEWMGKAPTHVDKANNREARWASEGVDASLELTHSGGTQSLQLFLRDPSSLGH